MPLAVRSRRGIIAQRDTIALEWMRSTVPCELGLGAIFDAGGGGRRGCQQVCVGVCAGRRRVILRPRGGYLYGTACPIVLFHGAAVKKREIFTTNFTTIDRENGTLRMGPPCILYGWTILKDPFSRSIVVKFVV